jgi:hypothetical protein
MSRLGRRPCVLYGPHRGCGISAPLGPTAGDCIMQVIANLVHRPGGQLVWPSSRYHRRRPGRGTPCNPRPFHFVPLRVGTGATMWRPAVAFETRAIVDGAVTYGRPPSASSEAVANPTTHWTGATTTFISTNATAPPGCKPPVK